MTLQRNVAFERDVVVIGGCGHVGLPLAVALADRGADVAVYDVDVAAVARVSSGRLPFSEPGAGPLLEQAIARQRLYASADPAIVGTAEHVIVVIGTPVDEHLQPDQQAIPRALSGCAEYLRDGQLLILRSTVYPGVTALVEKMIAGLGREIDVAFCPERIAEGQAMTELFELPQIISARHDRVLERAAALFGLQALFARFEWLYLAFRIGGAIYLFYLAIQLWRHARDPLPELPVGLAIRLTGWQGFLRALLLQLSNPKIMVFFGSIFLSLLPANLPAWMDATVLAIVAFNEFAWFALLALLFSGGPARAFYRRAKFWLDRFMGGALALLGLRLALANR